MTAIAAVKAPWGVLLAADGRMNLDGDKEPITDYAQKIFSIIDPGRTVAYALAGSIRAKGSGLDIREEFHRQISTLSDRVFGAPYEYASAIGQPVASVITSARYLPKSSGKAEGGKWKIADVILAGCFGPLVFLIESEFVHSHNVAEFRILGYYEKSYSVLYGPQAISRNMYCSPPVDSPLSKYIFDINSTGGNPSVSEAQRYAVGYIEACCSPMGRKLDPEGCRSIGGHIHVATVKPRSGFQWVIPPLHGQTTEESL
jgi:hypothetical protein